MPRNSTNVIIVGAGAAGLMASNELSAKCKVTIIESRNEPGGRIRTFTTVNGNHIFESGAEFIHGTPPITNRLLEDARLEKVKVEGKMWRKEGKEWSEEKDMIEGWDELIEKMKGHKKDMKMHDFMMKYFPGDKYASLRRHIRLFVEGFDVAEPDKVSVQSLYKEWSGEDDDYRIRSGYGSLIKYLEDNCRKNGTKMVTGDSVRQIDWQKNDVTVYTSSGEKYNGEKVIITVPVGVLLDLDGANSINLTPSVDEYMEAARKIGFGPVIKIIFECNEKIWKKIQGSFSAMR